MAAVDDLPTVSFEEQEILSAMSPKQHHHISMDNHQKVQVAQWVYKNKKDPAIKVSSTMPKVQLFFSFLLELYTMPSASQHPHLSTSTLPPALPYQT